MHYNKKKSHICSEFALARGPKAISKGSGCLAHPFLLTTKKVHFNCNGKPLPMLHPNSRKHVCSVFSIDTFKRSISVIVTLAEVHRYFRLHRSLILMDCYVQLSHQGAPSENSDAMTIVQATPAWQIIIQALPFLPLYPSICDMWRNRSYPRIGTKQINSGESITRW